jgi:hypothetical protein
LAGHAFDATTPGDHYFECPGAAGTIEIALDPPPGKPPAFRVLGITSP